MSLGFAEYPDSRITYLCRSDVMTCAGSVDLVATVRRAMLAHAQGLTVLPDEAYLGWRTTTGAVARSLAMPGQVPTPAGETPGLKIINGCLSNPDRGLARSQGLLVLFDAEIAWPTVVMESAYVSSLRTAAVTLVTAEALGVRPLGRLAVVGCGTLAKAHLMLLTQQLPELAEVRLYDTEPGRSAVLAAALADGPHGDRLDVYVATDPADCVRGAKLVVTVTTVTTGYLEFDWLAPGALVAHVSLDDVRPDVVERCDLVFVDDWNLVRNDHRRLLGRLYRAGRLRGPAGEVHPEATSTSDVRAVDGTIGDVLLGRHPGRRADSDVILSNPFGTAILDLAVGERVAAVAAELGIGLEVPA